MVDAATWWARSSWPILANADTYTASKFDTDADTQTHAHADTNTYTGVLLQFHYSGRMRRA